MKIALCLHGRSSGISRKGLEVDWQSGFDYYNQHIFIPNKSVDVFLHTDTAQQSEIESIYKPRMAIFEEDKQFIDDPIIRTIPSFNLVNDPYIHAYNATTEAEHQSICAKWYSAQQSILLKRQYEQQHNFKYDWVMQGRFDIAWQIDVIFSHFDSQYFYVPNWENAYFDNKIIPPDKYYKDKHYLHPEKMTYKKYGWPCTLWKNSPALSDHWCFASSDLMDQFGNLYNNIDILASQSLFWSNHIFVFKQLEYMGILDQIKFAFHRNSDFPLVRSLNNIPKQGESNRR